MLTNESTGATISKLAQKDVPNKNVLAVLDDRDYLDVYCSLFDQAPPQYTLCSDERLIRRKVKQNKILFDDRFKKRNRNADYPEDEFFSDNHLDLETDNYAGFGDYEIGNCSFCGKEGVPIYSLDEQSDLSDLISEVISVYEEFDEGIPLFDVLVNDWHIFNKSSPAVYNLVEAFANLEFTIMPRS